MYYPVRALSTSRKICKTSNEWQKPTNTSLVNNAILHIFEQVYYEFNGVEIDRSKRVWLPSNMKGWVSHNPAPTEFLQNAGWVDLLKTKTLMNENGQFLWKFFSVSPKTIRKLLSTVDMSSFWSEITEIICLKRSKSNLKKSNGWCRMCRYLPNIRSECSNSWSVKKEYRWLSDPGIRTSNLLYHQQHLTSGM